MALIKCYECGKEISDKAELCIHCGYPIKTNENTIKINPDNLKYNVILNEYNGTDKLELIREIRILLNKGLKEAKDLVDLAPNILLENVSSEIVENLKTTFPEIAKSINVEINDKKANNETTTKKEENIIKVIENNQNKPKCPHCNSTNIRKISNGKKAVHALTFGIFSKTAFSQFECYHCGYKW